MICSLKTIWILLACFQYSVTVEATNDTRDLIYEWCYINPDDIQNLVTPDKWYTIYPLCGGTKQSPINMITSETQYDSTLNLINITSDTGKINFKEVWKIINNGHTLKLESNKNYSFVMDSKVYSFQQMHFHWRGSEHKINNRKYAGELHMVHRNLNAKDDYSVVGFFLEVCYFM